MPLLCAIAIVRPEMKVIRGDSSVLLPGSSLHSARASKNYNLILFRTILHPPDSFVSKNEGMAEGCTLSGGLADLFSLSFFWRCCDEHEPRDDRRTHGMCFAFWHCSGCPRC